MRPVALSALFLVAGCWRGMPERPPLGAPSGGARPQGSEAREAAGGIAQKTITSKQEPATLIAFDGTRCVVTPQRFRETVVGEKVWCVWLSP